MFRNLFGTKNQKVEERVVIDKNVYNGKVYRGVFQIGDKVYEGAYIRDGVRTFITEDGITRISKGVKITQLERKPVSKKNSWCAPFHFIA